MKKVIVLVCHICIIFFSFVGAQSSEDSFYFETEENASSPTTVQRDILKAQVVEPNNGVLKRILQLFDLDQYTNLSNASALEYVTFVLNTALSLTSFVAFVIILYGFVKIIFAEDDEAISGARKTVQGAAIAIAIIALSRFLVTFLFNIYESVSGI